MSFFQAESVQGYFESHKSFLSRPNEVRIRNVMLKQLLIGKELNAQPSHHRLYTLFLLSETSPLHLPTTLAYFTLCSHELALCLQSTFPISGSALLKVKLKLIKSFWQHFLSIHFSIYLVFLSGKF